MKAVPVPEGLTGAFAWSDDGDGKVTLQNANQQTVTVQGVAISDEVDDEEITVEFIADQGVSAAQMKHDMTVVGVSALEFLDQQLWQWQPIGENDTVYLGLWTMGEFKAIPEPASAAWPDGLPEWGGLAAGNPPGDYAMVDAMQTGVGQVTATAGDTEASADVVIYEVIAKAADGEGDPPDVVAVGESEQIQGITVPTTVAGDYTRRTTWDAHIGLDNANEQTVTVNGLQVSGQVDDASLMVEFTPAGLGTNYMAWEPVHNMTVVGLDRMQYRMDD